MTFTITALSRCSGGNHFHFTVLVGGTTQREITLTKADLDLEGQEDLETAFLNRVRSALKEAGAVTLQESRATLLNKEFKI
jgi:hypothetical protein